MTDFFRNMIDDLKLENMAIAADGNLAADFSGYIDTGSYALNAVLSGSIYGGVPNNKITAFAGESTTGKCARGSEKIEVYMSEETAKKLGFI